MLYHLRTFVKYVARFLYFWLSQVIKAYAYVQTYSLYAYVQTYSLSLHWEKMCAVKIKRGDAVNF